MNQTLDALFRIGTLENPAVRMGFHFILLTAAGVISWCLFNLIVRKIEKKTQGHPFLEKNRHFFKLLKKAGHYVILILVGVSLVHLVKVPIFERCFFALLILVFAAFINDILKDFLPYLEDKLVKRTDTKIDNVLVELLNKFATIIIFIVAGILSLDVLGVNIMPFIAGAGVIGIAIGFAAKDTLSNVIAGILLIIDRPFEVGDRIEVWSAPVNSATWGDVLEIGLRATKIRTTDNIVIVIPNNEIMKRDIINYTTITEEIRVRIPLGIAYDANVDLAKKLIEQVSLELPWVMRDPPPKVIVKSFGESAVNLEARVWISEPRRRIDTISHLTDRVKDVFQKEGIEIPFPKRDIYIKKEVQ